MRPLRVLTALAIAASFSLAQPASAQQVTAEDKAAARQLGNDGQAALDGGQFAKAEDLFFRANKLYHAPTLMLGYARALRGQKKYVAAQEAYNSIVREGTPPGAPAVFKQAVDDAAKELAEVAPKIGGITVTVKAAGGGDVPEPVVTIDDKRLNAALLGVRAPADPGHHLVKVSANGFRAAEKGVDVAEGGNVDAPIVLEKDASAVVTPGATTTPTTAPATQSSTTPNATPATAPAGGDMGVSTSTSSKKTLAWVSFGVGGAGLAAGVVTGLMAMSKKSDLDGKCNNGTCNSSLQSDVDSYHSMGLISTVGFGVAAVGAGAGLYFLLTSKPDEPQKTGIAPFVGPGSVGAVGRF